MRDKCPAPDTSPMQPLRAQLMHEFFRMVREERARNLAAAERHRHRVDRKEIRFRKRLEDRFIEQTAAKARVT